MPSNDGNKPIYMPFLKFWTDEWLSSSIHFNCSLEEQGFFVALLALGNRNRKERGVLSLEKGQPMPVSVIANALFIAPDRCQTLLDIMIKQDRLQVREDGVLVIVNFDYYQNKYRRGGKAKQLSLTQTERQINSASYAKSLMDKANQIAPEVVDSIINEKARDKFIKSTKAVK